MLKLKDFIGKKIGNIEVLGVFSENNKQKFVCSCTCGKIFNTEISNILRDNPIKECRSCISKRTIKKAIAQTVKHGEAQKTKLYGVWAGMKRRCYNKNTEYYNRYGGRGIRVCDDWQEYIPFREWAMANGYQEGLTIDRIDNDGNYCPSNCKWVTMQEQQLHRCNTISIVKSNGEKLSMKELSNITGIKLSTLYERRRKNKNISYEELTKNI